MHPTNYPHHRRWLAALIVLFTPVFTFAQPAQHFVPEWAFHGDDISYWKTIGHAEWQAKNGIISGMSGDGGGWLVLPDSYQDVQLALRFQCEGACDAGLMLRMQKMDDGGHAGVYVSFADSLRMYRLLMDENGREKDRKELRTAAAMIRFAPDDDGGEASAVGIKAGDWNELHIAIDANIVRTRLNGWYSASSGATGDQSSGYGPLAFHVGGPGKVHFDHISTKNINIRHISPEVVSDNFTMQRIDEFYYAWDTAVADVNQDGVKDVVAGPYYYLGPHYMTRHEIYPGETYNPSTDYALNMITHAADFTGDGWPDVLATNMRPMILFVNPQGANRRWEGHDVMPEVISESTIIHDMDGDGQPEVVYAFGQGTIAYAEPDPASPTDTWIVHEISGSMGFRDTIHGLGVGDINSDGRPDILIPTGWFEQPARSTRDGKWPFHAVPFAKAGNIEGFGGGPMSVVDLNGDGLNDVATSLNAHGWGLAWFEQNKDAAGNISFNPHLIMGDFSWDNPGGVTFSQLHGGVEISDVDQDGVADLVTGKRYWSHLDSSTDPDPYGEAVLYWYRSVMNPQAPGGVSFEPELIHNRSGVGSQFEVLDLNEDGSVDIVTSGDRGTFIFWGKQH